MNASTSTGKPAGRRRFWITLACILIANVAGWFVWHSAFGTRRGDLLRVESFLPGENAIVSARPAISWRFNLDVAKESPGNEPPGVITPAVSGKWVWIDSRTLSFEPEADLPRATKISFRIPAMRLRTADGFVMGTAYESAIRTQPLRVTGVRQVAWENGDQFVIELKFNDRVLPADALAKLSITGPDHRPVKCRLHGEAAGNTVRVLTDPIPAANRTTGEIDPASAAPDGATDQNREPRITVKIAGGLAGTSGPLGLEEAFVQEVPLGRVLTATGIHAESPTRECRHCP